MLFNSIKEDRMKYLGKDSISFSILGLVISEIQRSNLSTEVPDEQVVKVIKKLNQGIEESILNATRYHTSDETLHKLVQEKRVLESYLPKQLTEDELFDIMQKAVQEVPERKTNKGAMFGYLKQNYDSLYDGKTANILFGKL